MSTRFTSKGIRMVDSRSLKLLCAAAAMHDQFTDYVAAQLHLKGFEGVSPAMLNFLSALDCGTNYGAELARRLKVSRQMVAKTVKELCAIGYLEQQEGEGKQKQILFTEQGEYLMAAARSILADLDQILIDRLSEAQVEKITTQLDTITGILNLE
jgi:DNA-binding MarR family transcriptional regulator